MKKYDETSLLMKILAAREMLNEIRSCESYGPPCVRCPYSARSCALHGAVLKRTNQVKVKIVDTTTFEWFSKRRAPITISVSSSIYISIGIEKKQEFNK